MPVLWRAFARDCFPYFALNIAKQNPYRTPRRLTCRFFCASEFRIAINWAYKSRSYVVSVQSWPRAVYAMVWLPLRSPHLSFTKQNEGKSTMRRRRHWLWLFEMFFCTCVCTTRSGCRRCSSSSNCVIFWRSCVWAAFAHENSDPIFRRMRKMLHKPLHQRRKMCFCSRWLKPLGRCHDIALHSFVDYCKAKIVRYKLLDRVLRGLNDLSSPKSLSEGM